MTVTPDYVREMFKGLENDDGAAFIRHVAEDFGKPSSGTRQMTKERLATFTDGVIAIIITISVLAIKVPQGVDFAELQSALPVFLAYVLSYVNVGIFWNNHHHLLQAAKRVDGKVLWANLFLLFWLSLLPFVIRWIGQSGIVTLPTAAFGVVLTMAAIGCFTLQRAIIACNGRNSEFAVAIGSDRKGKLSLFLCVVAIPMAFANTWISIALYVVVMLVWFVPDRRIELGFPGDN